MIEIGEEIIVWILFVVFSLLLVGAFVEIIVRNRQARFPNYFLPVLLVLMLFSLIYLIFDYYS